ncbi:hypothetical protein H9L17_13245 [Thermomonas brevis]|uniref:DUF2007 domain-containing protein n=1 Tax=Thermomonas brevis TaxID=215691 RepID=A0A7G9QS08_9GAMM|nr:hypothetical protein [Thermomonas brevis]QNN46133.1 hypothetical protein H9L17_13245 [Thermomonas brevis]
MRKVFSSQRLENVEAVADLLRKEGIAVRISNGRSYRSSRRATFSYDSRRTPDEVPSVWIVHSEDQPRGRQLLRDLGLLESTRDPGASYLPSGRHGDAAAGKTGFFSAKRIRLGLLALTVIGIGLVGFIMRKHGTADVAPKPAAPAATPAPPTLIPEAVTELQVYRADVPTALARLLVSEALDKRRPAVACLEVDNKEPSSALMQALTVPKGTTLHPASACPAKGAFAIAVHDYMTDGSGSGQVQLDLDVEDSQLVDVERNGAEWRVLRRH